MGDEKSTSYRTPVLLVLTGEFCERFCYYGLRTVLTMYMIDVLKFPEHHLNNCMDTYIITSFFTAIIGGMIADSWLGKYKTIVIVTFVYIAGCFLLAWGTMESLNIWKQPSITYVGMGIVAITSGIVVPCRAAFGGDQYKLPEEEIPFSRFFSWFLLVTHLGGIISTLTMPLVGAKFECLKESTCFAAAFGIPGVLLVLSLFTYGTGFRLYNIEEEPDRNIFLNVFGCLFYALFMRVRNHNEKKEHWLDFAADKYDQTFIGELKVLSKVFTLFAPLPVFWALYEQQYTGWNYQARQMNGEFGSYTVLPENMQVANAVFVVILILVFEFMVYPTLRMLGFGRPLQKMVVGGFLAAIAFFISAIVSQHLEKVSMPLPGPGYGQIRIYNTHNCAIKIECKELNNGTTIEIERMTYWAELRYEICGAASFHSNWKSCHNEWNSTLTIRDTEALGYYMNSKRYVTDRFDDDILKDPMGFAKIKFLVYHDREKDRESKIFTMEGLNHHDKVKTNCSDLSTFAVKPDIYKLVMGFLNMEFRLNVGGVYRLLVVTNGTGYWNGRLVSMYDPPQTHMFWQIPQYVFLAAAEVMFSVTGLEFAYSEAPKSMKTTIVALFTITYGFGKLIAVAISRVKLYNKQSSMFFFYSGLMVVDMLVFACLASRYTYANQRNQSV